MNFTPEMIARLSPAEQMLLRNLHNKAFEERPTTMAPEWPWTMKGPATPLQALRARTGVPTPLLKGDTAPTEELPPVELAS